MAEYTTNLGLFKPGTDNNLEVETTLRDNFNTIDDKLGSALTDLNGVKWTTLKARIDDYQSQFNTTKGDVENLKKKEHDVKLNDHFMRTISLRGMMKSAPENTLPSYRMACDAGVYGVWFDVQRTSDGAWVCIQDTTVDRTTTGTGTVANMTLSQLKALDAGTKFHSAYAQTRIPTLSETLDLLRTHQTVPYINIIGTYVDLNIKEIVDTVTSYGLLHSCVIVSSVLANLQRVRAYTNAITLGYYNTAHSSQVFTDAIGLGNAFVIYPHTVIDATVASSAQTQGVMLEAMMTSTTSMRSAIKGLAQYGVRGYITDKVYGMRGL